MISSQREDLIEQFAREIGAVRPCDVPAPLKRVKVRKQIDRAADVVCGQTSKPAGRKSGRSFCVQKAG
jgi:hypothetical protein